MKKIVILGAGISGLSAAWFIKKKFGHQVSVTLIEKENRVGGWIKTIQRDGFLFELGPHSLRASSQTTMDLIEAVGLKNHMLTAENKRRYLLQQGNLTTLSNSICIKSVLKGFLNDFWTKKSHLNDESIYDFFARRFNPYIAENLIDPLTTGIFAGDIRKLSIKSCFPKWFEWEKRHRSMLIGYCKSKKEKGQVFSFTSGMEILPQAIFKQLEAQVCLSTSVKDLQFDKEQIEITTSNGTHEADFVISTIPTYSLSFPIDVTYNSLAIVNLGYTQKTHSYEGFGYLIAKKEKQKILGAIWDSSIFPAQNKSPNETRISVIIEDIANTDDELLKIALESVSKHMHISTQPDVYHISRAMHAIPQYHVGHAEKIQEYQQQLKKISNRFLCIGTAFGGVSINDCIKQASKVDEVLASVLSLS